MSGSGIDHMICMKFYTLSLLFSIDPPTPRILPDSQSPRSEQNGWLWDLAFHHEVNAIIVFPETEYGNPESENWPVATIRQITSQVNASFVAKVELGIGVSDGGFSGC